MWYESRCFHVSLFRDGQTVRNHAKIIAMRANDKGENHTRNVWNGLHLIPAPEMDPLMGAQILACLHCHLAVYSCSFFEFEARTWWTTSARLAACMQNAHISSLLTCQKKRCNQLSYLWSELGVPAEANYFFYYNFFFILLITIGRNTA